MSSARKSTIFGRSSAVADAMQKTVALTNEARMMCKFFMLNYLSLVDQKSDMDRHVESFVLATVIPSLSES